VTGSPVSSTAREAGGEVPTRAGEHARTRAGARENVVHGYGAGMAAHEIVIWSDYI
jgi:hypothetical protein